MAPETVALDEALAERVLWSLSYWEARRHASAYGTTATSYVVLGGRGSPHGSAVERIALDRAAAAEIVRAVQRGLWRLAPERRRVVRDYYQRGLPVWRIAERTHQSESAVYRALTAARRQVALSLAALPPAWVEPLRGSQPDAD